VVLHDIARDGRVLLSDDRARAVVMARAPGMTEERDVSSLELSVLAAISRDGRAVLISEQSASGDAGYDVYLRPIDRPEPVHLGRGRAADLSPDGRHALALPLAADRALLVPTGVGGPTTLSAPGVTYHRASFFPDGARILILASERGAPPAFYEQSLSGGAP